jgi:hypothetical protein
VSPRKSRRKSACFSSTSTSTPALASSSPSIAPAGPQPAMQQVTSVVSTSPCMLAAHGPTRLRLVLAGEADTEDVRELLVREQRPLPAPETERR